jgi:soluble lytic murein transglycosylase-like protein
MSRNEEARRLADDTDRRLRPVPSRHRLTSGPRIFPEPQRSRWQTVVVLLLSLLLLAVAVLGHLAYERLEAKSREAVVAMAAVENKIQQLEASIGFDIARRQLLLGMRDHILKANPRVSLGDAYHYAELALEASEKYPAVDPLLLLAVGIVESGYDPQARSLADARGLYQIWPSTGRVLVRALGWSYDDSILYDPAKNTEAAALYLDVLFATYNDLELVLAEYNGGPINAGYFRSSARALAPETRKYVPRVLALYDHLREEFAQGIDLGADSAHRDGTREGKTLRPQ